MPVLRRRTSFTNTIAFLCAIGISAIVLATKSNDLVYNHTKLNYSTKTGRLSRKSRSAEMTSAGDGIMRMKSSGHVTAMSGSASDHDMEKSTLGSMVLNVLNEKRQEQDELGAHEENHEVPKMLVHSGDISLDFPVQSDSVDSADSIANQIEAIVRVDGKGYTESKFRNKNTIYRYGSYEVWNVHLVVRVASAEFGTIMERIQSMATKLGGTVQDIQTRSSDVTDQYIDTRARADALAASRKAIESIMARVDKIQDVLEIQRELNSLIQQEESKRKTALQLKNSADMSTIKVTITQRIKDDIHVREEKPRWHPKIAFGLAVEHMTIVVQSGVDIFTYAIVWLLPLVSIFHLFRILSKRIMKD